MKATRAARRRGTSLPFSFEDLENRLAPATGLGDISPSLPIDFRPIVIDGPDLVGTGLPTAQGDTGSGINLPAVRATYPYRGNGYTVAVLDTGVDYRHPALGGSFRTAGTRVIDGYDFVNGADGPYVEGDFTPGPDSDPMDHNGHGTNIAGIIGSSDDVYYGVASGINLVALRVLDKNGNGAWEWVSDALQWIINHQSEYNIVAVNMSFGTGNYQEPISEPIIDDKLEALVTAGVSIIASSGNEFYGLNSQQGIEYPAISTSAISVGAVFEDNFGSKTWANGARDFTSARDRIVSFTQRSPLLDVMAPGAMITNAYLSSGGLERYATYAGTSQAAPFVTGSAALLHQVLDQSGQSGRANQATILGLLRSTGVIINDGDDENDNVVNTVLNFRRIDLLAAIREALRNVPAADRFEPNETQAKAKYLGSFSSTVQADLSLHTTADLDWFRFNVAAVGIKRFEVRANVTNGAKFTFYDFSVNRQRTLFSHFIGGAAVLDVDLRNGVNYFIKIEAAAGAPVTYSLRIGQSAKDRFEPNETRDKAKFLGVVDQTAVSGLSLHDVADRDWYRFQAVANGEYRIEARTPTGSGAVKFTFYDVTVGKNRTIVAQLVNGIATVSTWLRSGVNYFLQVEPLNGLAVSYSLSFSRLVAGSLGPVLIDRVLGG